MSTAHRLTKSSTKSLNKSAHALNDMLSNLQKRFALFLFVCVPLRAFLVYLAATRTDLMMKHRLAVAGVAFMVGCGFMYLYVSGSRVTGIETFGTKIWWNALRPVHGFLYLYCAYLVLRVDPNAYLPLLLDVTIGAAAFLWYHNGLLELK